MQWTRASAGALLLLCACESTTYPDASRADTSIDADSATTVTTIDATMDAITTIEGGADSATGDSGAEASVRYTIPRSTNVLVGIIGTGQSLSVGATSTPALSTQQPYENVRLRDTGSPPLYDGVGDLLSLAPLIEPVRSDIAGGTGLYPNNIAGETPHTAMAIELSRFADRRAGELFASAHTVVGESGRGIDAIRRGGIGRAYASSLYEVAAFTRLAAAEGRRYEVGAVVLTHGETDWNNANYNADLRALVDAYREDVPRITGQRQGFAMILSQQASLPGTPGWPLSTQLQWRASVDHAAVILCSGPKYQMEFNADHVHLTAAGSRALGIKYGQVYAQQSFEGRAWRPLEPVAVRRDGARVAVTFHVPVGPIEWERSLATPHTTAHPMSGPAPTAWAAGRGFELEQASAPVAIQSVEIQANTVFITPAQPLAAGPFTVRYAMTQDVSGYTAGTPWSRAGQLRDSDPYRGHDAITVMATVTEDSPVLRVSRGSLNGHGVRAWVHGSGLPRAGAVVIAATDATITLSERWSGPSLTVPIEVQSDQRNYAVHFEWLVRD